MKCDNCGTTVRPVVALDVDGTLADYHLHFIHFLEKYLNVSDPEWESYDGSVEFSDHLRLSKYTYREAKLAFRSGGFKRWMPVFQEHPMPFGMFLSELQRLPVDIWIATSRPWRRLDMVDRDLEEWLLRWRIRYSGIVMGENKYQQLIDNIDLFRIISAFDDEPEQLEIASHLGIPILPRVTQWNKGAFSDEDTCNSYYDMLTQISADLRQWEKES